MGDMSDLFGGDGNCVDERDLPAWRCQWCDEEFDEAIDLRDHYAQCLSAPADLTGAANLTSAVPTNEGA